MRLDIFRQVLKAITVHHLVPMDGAISTWPQGGIFCMTMMITPRKSNIDIKNDGFLNVSPFKYGYFG